MGLQAKHETSAKHTDAKSKLKGFVVVRLPQHPAKILRADCVMACAKAVRNLFEHLAVAST